MSSEESYDPEDDKKRKDDKNRKKARLKTLRKRERVGRARDVALKQQRRNRGEINRSVEIREKQKSVNVGTLIGVVKSSARL